MFTDTRVTNVSIINRYWPKIGGGLGPHLAQCGLSQDLPWAETYLPTKWHLDPSSHSVTTRILRLRFSMFADTVRVTNVCIINRYWPKTGGGGSAPLGEGSWVPI